MSDIQLNNRFSEVFGNTPIIGMVHLAGEHVIKRIARAVEEVTIYEEEGVDAALIENYHYKGIAGVIKAMEALKDMDTKVTLGINILPNEFETAFPIAYDYGGEFIQLDYIAGKYKGEYELDEETYKDFKFRYKDISVIGGVDPKYYAPVPEFDLEKSLNEAMERAEAIGVSGKGTGEETPIEKIKQFKEITGDRPLIVAAGLNPDNAVEQLKVADGGIVGSCFKPNKDTTKKIDRELVRDFIRKVNEVRDYKKSLN